MSWTRPSPFEMPAQTEMADMTSEEKRQLRADFDAAMPSRATVESLSQDEQVQVQERVMTAAAQMPDTVMEEPMPAGLAGVAVARDAGRDAGHDGDGCGNRNRYTGANGHA